MKHFVKVAITVILFVLIFRNVDGSAMGQVLAGANPFWLLPALFFQFLSTFVASYRWYLIMAALEFSGAFRFYFRSYFKGSFFNQALPTSIGGDALRVLDVGRLGHSKKEAFYGVFIDRIVGLGGLLLLNLFANIIDPDLLPGNVFYAINGLVLLSITGIFVLALLRKLKWLAKVRGLHLFHELSRRFRAVYRTQKSISVQISLSILIHLFSMVAIYCLGRGVGLDYSLTVFLVLVPPAILLTIIPVSLAGWGVREGAMIGLFLLVGAEREPVLAVSILYGLLLIATSLPGLYVYLTDKHKVL